MNILLVTEVIHPGGAETFVLRLSNALRQKGHNVRIFTFYKHLFNEGLYKQFAEAVPITHADIPFPRLMGKIDSALFRLNINYSVRDTFIKHSLKKLVRAFAPTVIHSHLLKADKLCLQVAKGKNIPVVTTIHGDYLQFYNKTQQNIPIPLLQYAAKASYNLQHLAHVVCISDKQIQFFKQQFDNYTKGKISKIYNGYDGKVTGDAALLRRQLGIPENDFIFGMVSRGIAEKGWETAIKAFLQLNKPDTHLLLVGESEYLQTLKNIYSSHKNIHFTGQSDKPLEWIAMMDVGLLPTTYPSESLPTVIIEYLCCSIPSIASDAGEIVNMLQVEGKKAGIITPIENNTVQVNAVTAAMNQYMNDTALYNKHKKNAAACYEQFDMDKCIAAYCAVYENAASKAH